MRSRSTTISARIVAGVLSVCGLGGGAGLLRAAPILDASSSRISFQARITQGNGVPIGGQDVDLEFRLYNQSGQLLGPGISVPDVPVAPGGLINVMVPFDPGDFNGTAREIGLSVNGGPELSPRWPIGSVPYAYRVNRVTSGELDDFLALGAAGQAGGLTIYGSQPTPTFFLDGNQNRLTLASDDTTGSVILLAENGNGSVTAGPTGQPRAALDGGNGDVWGRSTVNVGTIGSPLGNSVAYASLQFGASFGGRMLAWDPTRELTTVVGSTAGSAGGGLLQLYRGGSGGLTVEMVGDDGNGSGRGDWRDADANTTVRISGEDHRLYTYGADDAEHARLGGAGSGNLQLRGGGASNPLTVNMNAAGGGALDLLSSDGSRYGLRLSGGTSTSGGRTRVYNTANQVAVDVRGDETSGGGSLRLRHGNADRVFLDSEVIRMQMFDPNNVETVRLGGNGGGGGGFLSLRNSNGAVSVEADGDEGDAGIIRVRNAAGAATITLRGDLNGVGRVTTGEMQITGGSDLSERFDVAGDPRPGMVVSIDPDRPGCLIVTREAYDRKVAGIISGANGVKTGMSMGQSGTIADGRHPIALSGRVYCHVDAAYGAVRPGDLLTSSKTPGHAMRVDDHASAHGAIIGKAMTSLKNGRGLVLVLVNLH